MKVLDIHLDHVGGIQDLTIPLDPRMNIICGPNGIGKTTILEALAHCFTNGETKILKRNVRAQRSQIVARIKDTDEVVETRLQFTQFEPNEAARLAGRHAAASYLLSFKTVRTVAYAPLGAVSRDKEKTPQVLWDEARTGIKIQDVKNWFVNRFLYSVHPEALTAPQIANFELAKRCFSALDSSVSFKTVRASTNEIVVETPGGDIYYEYLSSGFKSCLSIMLGIIKEIEYRFPDGRLTCSDFAGVVLIDEIEMHLHPNWQSKIAPVLTSVFPNIQFIVTTHSPHMIQAAEPNQIVALEMVDGLVTLRALPATKYGFKGWTLDEVLTDVMGMEDTRSDEYTNLMQRFSSAIDKQDYPAASDAYKELDTSLHPRNHTRKLLKLQLASLAPDNDKA